MNQEELKKILPHRDAMLLIEEAEVVTEQQENGEEKQIARGRYHVRGDEWFLQGHFPGNPIVPGVIQCEMMAQNCCVLLASQMEPGKRYTPFFTGLDKVKFKSMVRPGDTLEFTCSILRSKGPFYFAEGKGTVNGKLAVKGEFSFALMEEENGNV